MIVGEGVKGFDDLVEAVSRAAEAGFSPVWMGQIFGYDALTALAAVGREVPEVDLGTAVVPTYPRHPMVMAIQALTVQAATGGRLVLGVGLSHQIVIEGMFGLSFDRPALHMTEYLSVLAPLIREGSASFEGETLKWSGAVNVPGSRPCPILLAALAPRMLRLAGEVADGTVTWMTGPATIAGHIVPLVRSAAEAAGRPSPTVAVGLPVSVTNDVEGARERASNLFSIYGQLPSYRAMLDREGAGAPGEVAVVGDEEQVARQLEQLAAGGATHFNAAVFGSSAERSATVRLLSDLAGR